MSEYRNTYELQPLILFGVVASSSVIFLVFILLLLGSQDSAHSRLSTDTVAEMVGYVEFFLFAVGSYFLVTAILLSRKEFWSRFVPSWLPISVFGSFLFSYSFIFRNWAAAVLTYKVGDPSTQRPGSFIFFLFISLFVSVVLSIISVITCYVAAYISGSNKSSTELIQIIQKY